MNKQKYTLIPILCTTALILLACAFSGIAASKATETPTPTSTSTPTTAYTATIEPTATKTQRPTPRPRPTSTPNLEATERYEGMAGKVKEYHQAAYISTDAGKYKRLEAFVDSWAQIDWYQWMPIDGNAPDNFIIRSDIHWQSASKTANESGCGFVFRLQEDQDHYMIFVSIDGYVYTSIVRSGDFESMGRAKYGKPSIDGKAALTLIAEGSTFSILVDDKLIKRYEGMKNDMLSGDLAYTIVSGTNKDYGTRCTFEHVDLWTITK
jgi:hypothetical protein